MNKGKLIVASNHLGNVSDIPRKTVMALKNTKNIFCEYRQYFIEDVVKPNKLSLEGVTLTEFGGKDPEMIRSKVLKIVKSGEDVLIIPDAGTIGFSDYGTDLVGLMYENGITVEIIPGPSIVSAAIAAAGIPGDSESVYFGAFFHCDNKEAKEKLEQIKNLTGTLVLLQMPTKLYDFTQDVLSVFGEDRLASICINLGMSNQTILHGSLENVSKTFSDMEITDIFTTLVVSGKYDLLPDDKEPI